MHRASRIAEENDVDDKGIVFQGVIARELVVALMPCQLLTELQVFTILRMRTVKTDEVALFYFFHLSCANWRSPVIFLPVVGAEPLIISFLREGLVGDV